jgi:Flp pilus assembly protein CpaB
VVSALVAKCKLRCFELLNRPEKLFEVQEFPRDSVPKEALTCFDDLRGDFRLNKTLAEGSWVTRADLIPKDWLPPGTELATIHWEFHGGGGVLPGSYVDIISCDDEGKNGRVILENLLVLAVPMEIAIDDDGKNPRIQWSMKLAVRPGDKEKLETAASRGKLFPVLRPWVNEGLHQQARTTGAEPRK